MPNFCSNSMSVRGPQPDLDRFVEAVQGIVFGEPCDLVPEALFPPPPDAPQGWRVDNWGTRSVYPPIERTLEEGLAWYHFDSAGDPPLHWMLHVSKLYPSLTFSIGYSEDGYEFTGHAICAAGVVKEYEQRNYMEPDQLEAYYERRREEETEREDARFHEEERQHPSYWWRI